ncbi:MAG: hypothetical protein IJX98_06900 [Clostridia bacterium]|nr:hypothetical protein [Clostridia bacterium]
MPPFDLEQGKLSVRVSEGVYYQLLADIDDFGFRKSDGSDNISGFFNQLLPNLIAYRIEKRKDLRKYLEKNIIHCIKDNYQDKLLYFMDDLFDCSYFDDYREHYHRQTFHFRLNKANIIKLQGFFDELEEQNQNKTSYLRNLFNEYVNMRKDKREGLCFDDMYSLLYHAINNKCSIKCSYKDKNYLLLPYKIDLNYVDGSLYLIALETENLHICHTFRLCWLRSIVLKEVREYVFSEKVVKKLDYLVYNYDYTGKTTINLSKLKTV